MGIERSRRRHGRPMHAARLRPMEQSYAPREGNEVCYGKDVGPSARFAADYALGLDIRRHVGLFHDLADSRGGLGRSA